MTGPDDVYLDSDYILDCLTDCRDALARLLVDTNGADRDALLALDAATRTLEANGRDGD